MVVGTLGVRLATSSMTPRQYGYLFILVFYTSGMTFLLKKSRIADSSLPDKGLYSIPVSVFLAELLKYVVSIAVELAIRKDTPYKLLEIRSEEQSEDVEQGHQQRPAREKFALKERSSSQQDVNNNNNSNQRNSNNNSIDERGSPPTISSIFKEDVLAPDCWKLSVPAALYVAQNLLQMVAITTVSPVTYQAVTQCKLLATTLLSVWLLFRLYSAQQWGSIFVLLIGVIIVSVSKIKDGSGHSKSEEETIAAAKLLGVLAVLLACTLGSGAAVYMEKVLKSDIKTSLWIRNAQLSLFSLIPAGFAVFYEAWNQGAWHPLRYFGLWAWLSVIARSITGFWIAFILKQTDALVKGIATSIAMVLSIFIESILYNVSITASFAFGAFLVVASSCVYVKSGLK